jgi:hypothetical protein
VSPARTILAMRASARATRSGMGIIEDSSTSSSVSSASG